MFYFWNQIYKIRSSPFNNLCTNTKSEYLHRVTNNTKSLQLILIEVEIFMKLILLNVVVSRIFQLPLTKTGSKSQTKILK